MVVKNEAKLENPCAGPSKNQLNTIIFKVTCECGREHLLEVGMLEYKLAARLLEQKTMSPLSKVVTSIPGLKVRTLP